MVSPTPIIISSAVEGPVDEAVVKRLISDVGGGIGPFYGKIGKSHIRQRLHGFNKAAHYSPWIVLVDLNHEAECSPQMKSAWLENPAPYMCFRVAVREVESWLLADRERFASFFGVRVSDIPLSPESIDNPKEKVVELAKKSRSREIRQDMVPRFGSGRMIGPAYVSRLIEFVSVSEKGWRPDRAAQSSDSLRRCLTRLRELATGRSTQGRTKS